MTKYFLVKVSSRSTSSTPSPSESGMFCMDSNLVSKVMYGSDTVNLVKM